jgi:hypothetical protein
VEDARGSLSRQDAGAGRLTPLPSPPQESRFKYRSQVETQPFLRSLGSTNVASLIERKTPYAVLFRNKDRSSKMLMSRLINLLPPLPVTVRRSITFDRGFEFVS